MLSAVCRLPVLFILLFLTVAPVSAELDSGNTEGIPYLALISLFFVSKNVFVFDHPLYLQQTEEESDLTPSLYSDSPFICFPQGKQPSSDTAGSTQKSDSSSSNPPSPLLTKYTAFEKSFRFSSGNGDDDPEKSNDGDEKESPVSDVCPICLEALDSTTMELTYCCGRLFHIACLDAHYHTSAEPTRCPLCRRSPFFYPHHIADTSSAPGRRPLRCNHCSSSFLIEPHFINHLRMRHDYCWYCPIEIGNNFDIQEHCQQHGFVCMCIFCNFPTNNANSLGEHITHSHSYQQYSDHMQTHQPYLCLLCTTQFATAAELREHLRSCFTPESDN